jgi:transposase InsO family protein
MLGISKQSVHQHQQRELQHRTKLESLLIDADVLRSAHPGCGVEKMYYTLRPDWIGRDRFIEFMMNQGYRVQTHKSYTRTTTPACYKYPNLIEGMILWDKNQLWQSDITYIRVMEEYYYLVFIIDVYTKLILGYQVSNHLRAEANLSALRMAIRNCNGNIIGLIHHSDRGSQYIDTEYIDLLKRNGAHISMGLKAQDNAYAERINGIIKNEYLKYRNIKTLTDLKKHTRQAVNHYNNERNHSSLNDKPNQFEKNLLNLSSQKRPKVIIYAEGNPRIKEALSHLDSLPEKNLQAPICPMVFKENSK